MDMSIYLSEGIYTSKVVRSRARGLQLSLTRFAFNVSKDC